MGKKSKKSNKTPKAPKVKPNGFEEFYADPPITPEEAIEERHDLYSPTRPFPDRIQTCIQRYRARRKLDEIKANCFNKYLILGGIESTNKAFTGGALDDETLATTTADEIAAIQATDFVRPGNKKYYDPAESDKWIVDWEGVAKGFLIPTQLEMESEQLIKLYCAVIKNFLNYVLQHEVCPEYVEDVMAARRICGQAEEELNAIRRLGKKLPGNFNIALSTLFGGVYFGINQADQPWQEHAIGMTVEKAEEVLKKGVQALDALGYVWKKADIVVISSTRDYEVTAIELPKEEDGMLGFFKCKPWEGPQSDVYEAPNKTPLSTQEETFYVDADIIELIQVGMKVEMIVREIDNGFKFFDHAGFFCSFYTCLENEKMVDWKEPVLNTRPGPTEDDPDAEERMMQSEMAVE
ncbi:hypothetical protein GLAREA_01868 [Glarea lozoyensis ATCC 20868]|uniref:Argonaute-binding protein 1 n=2 Tax=Glarea lozoyensis TaxID=101852 RepID=S3D1P3_GLAL2|nr:uncharacterized protein GLAREA_01868 [Glarea lozoyensis ATCC 20868]EHL02546.1 putative Argonaute-binding protein 1 [Glarea lozoyensis 74030]EPE25956.1 hypothetical protein GLAREA_01868 [Glarea lozoyensis ATCC 20868]